MRSWGDDQQVVDAPLEAERAIWASVQPSSTQTLLVKSKTRGTALLHTTFESQRDHGVPLVTRMPGALKIGH
jgi:hypothetical protein